MDLKLEWEESWDGEAFSVLNKHYILQSRCSEGMMLLLSAAGDMYEALEDVVNLKRPEQIKPALEKARAALRKANGDE